MTAKQVQFRRGTTAEYATFTGAVGEITVDTTAVTARVHDGSTVGGFPLAHAGANTDITSVILDQTGLEIKGGSPNTLTIKPNETFGADRTLNIVVNDADRTIDLSGDLTVSSAATISGTSSGTNTGDQNVFQTISVSGQSDVVADTTTDTLTLVAGTNVTITTDASTDSITINSTGGIVDTDYGDITVSAGGTVWTIDNEAVTYAKIQDVSATDKILGRQTAGAGTIEEIDCTAAGRALLDDATASDQRTTLGLGTIATQDANNVSITGGSITGITDLAVADGGTGASDAGAARTNLGLTIGTDVQAYDPELTAIAGLAVTDGNFIVGNGTTWVAESGSTARTSLGLGTLATQDANNVSITGGSITGITDLAIADGGTGASDAATACTNLGLGTGDSPQFTAVNIGDASDTTLTRVSAGNLAVEGNVLYRAGGTDVALADGGTGASLTDPNADRILFWDDSAGAVTWLAPAAGVEISGTTLNGNKTPTIQLLTSGTNATYTPPSGCRSFYAEVVGGGGGGGGSAGAPSGAGAAGAGGGAGYSALLITNLSQTFKYTIGAGGTGGAAGDNNGTTGGTSYFYGGASGTTILAQATGGSAGPGVTASTGNVLGSGGSGGGGTVGTLNLSGSRATAGRVLSGTVAHFSLSGSAPFFGGGSWNGGSSIPGPAGKNYGEGGTAAYSTTSSNAGGDGAAGVIRITEFY